MKVSLLRGFVNRLLQLLAQMLPGAGTIRVMLHRARGVRIGKDVFIGLNAILETAYPQLITIEDRVVIGIRVTVVAHMQELKQGVRIEQDAYIGPGVIILPNVTIGRGAVVTAGSVVTRSVLPMSVVQGNPAVPVATCGVPLTQWTSMKEFRRKLKPFAVRSHSEDRAVKAREAETSI